MITSRCIKAGVLTDGLVFTKTYRHGISFTIRIGKSYRRDHHQDRHQDHRADLRPEFFNKEAMVHITSRHHRHEDTEPR